VRRDIDDEEMVAEPAATAKNTREVYVRRQCQTCGATAMRVLPENESFRGWRCRAGAPDGEPGTCGGETVEIGRGRV
jgi:hypothetical protein